MFLQFITEKMLGNHEMLISGDMINYSAIS